MKKLTYRSTLRSCYIGYVTQAIIVNLAPLLFIIFQESYGLTFEQVGRLVLLNFSVQILADVFSVRYVDRIGLRRAAVLAHAFACCGLVLLAVLPGVMRSPYAGLSIAVVVYAAGGGLLEVLVSLIVDALPGEGKESDMSLLHSFYCWGQVAVVLLSTLFLFAFGTGVWRLLPLLWAAVPAYNLVRFLRVPMPAVGNGDTGAGVRGLLRAPAFAVALLVMLCAGASEQTISQWSSLFAERGLGVDKVIGDILGPCLFAVFMGVGRAVYGVLGARLRLGRALKLCGILCVACYLCTVFAPWPLLSLSGCALCGLAVSLMWPGTLSLTAQRFRGSTAMFGLAAIFGDIGAAAGPWLSGLFSDAAEKSAWGLSLAGKTALPLEQFSLRFGILAGIVFPIVLTVGVCFLSGKRDGGKGAQASAQG